LEKDIISSKDVVKMNKKGELGKTLWLIMGLVVIALIFLIVALPNLDRLRDSGNRIAEFGDCERGIGGEYGMCSPRACAGSGAESIAGTLKTCPSSKTRSILKVNGRDNSEVNKYQNCCLFETCSDFIDSNGVARIPACFGEMEDTGRNKGCETGYEQELCLGYAEDCLPEDGCCCVIPGTNE